jgi:hypothetical protein
MGQMTKISLALETANYRGTGGVSENNRGLAFQPAFVDRETGTVHLSRFPDGRLAPCHLLDGLPAEVVLARNEQGRAMRVKASVVSGFVHEACFYTRQEAAAMLGSAAGFDNSRIQDRASRRAA